MNHKVNDVTSLYNSAAALYNNVVVGGDSSADSILSSLNSGIENLKNNWKGQDAGARIQELILVYNKMVSVRNNLAKLASDSSAIAAVYREIQRTNGAALDALTKLSYENRTTLGDYSDTSDTININEEASKGRDYVDSAKNALDNFESNVKSKYTEIMDNWTAGSGRETAVDAFNDFITNVGQYKQVLAAVSTNITNALANYL